MNTYDKQIDPKKEKENTKNWVALHEDMNFHEFDETSCKKMLDNQKIEAAQKQAGQYE